MEQRGNILLVDDNDDDAFFIEKALKSAGSSAHIFRCIDGRETQNYLLAQAPFADRGFYPLPDLVLLDLKIPHIDGLELVRWIRAQPSLRSLIVVILTSSSQQRDIDEACLAGELLFNQALVPGGNQRAGQIDQALLVDESAHGTRQEKLTPSARPSASA